MAKVMISMPDELLAKVDKRAKAIGTTRSGYFQQLAQRAVELDVEARLNAIQEILARARPHGVPGTAADWIREDRDRDNP